MQDDFASRYTDPVSRSKRLGELRDEADRLIGAPEGDDAHEQRIAARLHEIGNEERTLEALDRLEKQA